MRIKFLQSTALTVLLSCVLTHSVFSMDDDFPEKSPLSPLPTPRKTRPAPTSSLGPLQVPLVKRKLELEQTSRPSPNPSPSQNSDEMEEDPSVSLYLSFMPREELERFRPLYQRALSENLALVHSIWAGGPPRDSYANFILNYNVDLLVRLYFAAQQDCPLNSDKMREIYIPLIQSFAQNLSLFSEELQQNNPLKQKLNRISNFFDRSAKEKKIFEINALFQGSDMERYENLISPFQSTNPEEVYKKINEWEMKSLGLVERLLAQDTHPDASQARGRLAEKIKKNPEFNSKSEDWRLTFLLDTADLYYKNKNLLKAAEMYEELIKYPNFNSRPFDVVFKVHEQMNNCVLRYIHEFLKAPWRLVPLAEATDKLINNPCFGEQQEIYKSYILSFAIVYNTLIKNDERLIELYELLMRSPEFKNESTLNKMLELCKNISAKPLFNTKPIEWQEHIISLQKSSLEELSKSAQK